jgi:YVTN family beta-propeller protein
MAAYIRSLTLFLCVLLAVVMGVAAQEKVEERRDAQQLAVMAYVLNAGNDTVSVINTVTHQVNATISVKNGFSLLIYASTPIVITPNGAQAYVLDARNCIHKGSEKDIVSVINTTTNQVTAIVPVGLCPTMMAITPNGAQVYVVNSFSNDVTVIDTVTNKVISTISVGTLPYAVSFVTVPTSIETKTSAVNKMTN